MAVEHVFYEVHRLSLWSSVGLPPAAYNLTQADVIAELVGQATLESALLHLRNTVDFLIDERPRSKKFETDLVADDYFDDGWDGRPTCLFGNSVDEHEKIMQELHRRLAHLSIQRLENQPPGGGFVWTDVMRHVPAVLGSFRRFVDDLNATHPERGAWFRKAIEAIDSRFPAS